MVLRWTIILKTDIKREVNVKWRVAKYATNTRNLCSAFNPSKCTHTVNTHTPWTHTRSSGQPYCCGARGAVGGSVPCSRVSPQSWYWGWRESWTFTPPIYNPCLTWDSNPQPLGDKSDSLSIRVRKQIKMFRCVQFFFKQETENIYISPKPDTIIINLNTLH